MDELSVALRNAFLETLKKADMKIQGVSNYNISRAAGSKIFTMILYRNVKTEEGDKRQCKLVLDSDVSTLVVAIGVLESMLEEVSKENFLSKTKPKEEKKQTADAVTGW